MTTNGCSLIDFQIYFRRKYEYVQTVDVCNYTALNDLFEINQVFRCMYEYFDKMKLQHSKFSKNVELIFSVGIGTTIYCNKFRIYCDRLLSINFEALIPIFVTGGTKKLLEPFATFC